MITRTFKLCLNAGTGSAPFINVSQTDKDEVWLFELYTETGERYIPSSGAIIGIKSDGHGIANTGTVDSEGRVVITETEQMTATAGRSIFELSIDGLTHGTANFIVNVEKKPIDGAIMSDSDLSLISQAVDSAAVIVDVIGDGDPSEVIGEHVDAWLDNHPEATTTVEDGAITAPKINSTLWDKLLVSEEASGAVASFDDGADDVPVSSLKVALEPIQTGSGDPSPSNVRPIYPANGKNLFDIENANILNAYINGSNTITGSVVDRMVYIPILANQQFSVTYTQKALATASQSDDMQIGLFDSIPVAELTGVRIYNATRSAPTVDMKVSYTGNSSSHTWLAMKIGNTNRTDIHASMATLQIEYGTVTPYQPYQGIMVKRIGKNLLPNQTVLKTGNNYFLCATSANDYPIHLKTGTYTIQNKGVKAYCYGEKQGGSSFTIHNGATYTGTFTVTEEGNYKFWYYQVNVDETQFYDNMLEVGTETTEYEPYIGNSYPYTLGQSVYGGTVDLATGVLTVDRAIKTVKWSAFGSKTTLGNFVRGLSNLTDRAVYPPTADKPQICDVAPYKVAYSEDSLHFYVNATTINMFLPVDTDGDTDISVCYELATPQTIQLTPTQVKTLLGYNNISSSGTVDVIYHADTKLYVDKMTAVDNAVIAPTEETFTATRNYTVNDLLIVADTLYKVTANIASGSAITPNSNVTATTLGALIKALS